jgi:hypothetical protein
VLFQILSHTPHWVFIVFALMLWMGARQLGPTRSHWNRVIGMRLAMTAFAIYGVATAFGHSPAGLWGVAGWVVAAAFALARVSRLPLNPAVRYDAATRRFFQPGSWAPLALMIGVFLTKYVVSVTLALHPDDARQAGFALGVSTLYGLFSGIYLGRALRLWKLTLGRPAPMAAA